MACKALSQRATCDSGASFPPTAFLPLAMKLTRSHEEHSAAHAVKWPADITDRTSSINPPNHAGHAAVIASATVRLPIHFFVFSLLWLVCGSVLLPWLAPRAIRFYYQPSVLSLAARGVSGCG